MLKTDFISIHQLFSGPVQFVIPVYQRHYVWNQEEQWEPLWRDIIEIIKVNAKVEEPHNHSSHFTGAIVTRQRHVKIGEIPQYDIIDGQQRLTTFQIILCAIADVCRSAKLKDNEDQAVEYLTNGGLLHNRHQPNQLRDPAEKYKVIPRRTDRESFQALIDGTTDRSQGPIRDAYDFFKGRIEEYMRTSDDHRFSITSLTYFILHNFGVAQILITTSVNSERIFESINARGRTINEFDHLRNNIFLNARVRAGNPVEAEDQVEDLYKNYWHHFEDRYWTKRLGPDAEEMLLSERFVQHFLMAKLGKSSIVHRDLFSIYEREYRAGLPKDQGIQLEFLELEKYSKVYRVILDCEYDGETCREFHPTRRMELLAQRMEFYKALNITSLYPFILYIMNELNIPYNELEAIFDILESYTIRRLLGSSQGVRNYDTVFATIIGHFGKNQLSPTALLDYLLGLQNGDKCPDDETVQSALAQCGGTRISTLLTRYILYRIELAKATSYRTLRGPLSFGKHLTLEHVMPIKWQQHWPLPNPQNLGLADERNRAKQSIGNLTLLTKELNEDLGNLNFSDKRGPLLEHSSDLKLTQEIVYESVNPVRERRSWDVAHIRDREKELVKYVCEEIWPFMPVHSGELKNWHPSFTNGVIIDAHGEEVPVEKSEFKPSDIALLKKGTKVKYEKVPIEGGFKAVNVVRV